MLTELRSLLRGLRRRPLSSLLIVAVLALGLAATVAVFSVVRAVLLRPLPFRDADRLVRIESVTGGEPGRVSMLEVRELRELEGLFVDVAAYVPGFAYTVSGEEHPEELSAIAATGNLFEVLGATFLRGGEWPESFDRERSFGVVLSERAWRSSFRGEEGVVGGSASLDGVSYTVFGILPRGFDFPRRTDLYRSIYLNEAFPGLESRDRRIVVAVARLRAGVSLGEARRRLEDFAARQALRDPETSRGVGLTAVPLRETYVGDLRSTVVLLAVAVGLVLAVAVANAAALLLARALARKEELALRAALGASRLRLVGSLVAESLLLALAGAGVGVLAGRWAVGALLPLARLDLPAFLSVRLDAQVVLGAVVAAVAAGVVAGLIPGLRATRPSSGRPGGARGAAAGGQGRSLRRALVITEIGLSAALVLTAAQVVEDLRGALRLDPGFAVENRLSFRVSLTWRTYSDDDRVRSFHTGSLAALQRIPGVVAAALGSTLPLASVENESRAAPFAEGQTATEAESNPRVGVHRVSPEYRRVLAVPLRSGRDLESSDRVDSPLVALVDERLAGRLWPSGSALGRRLRLGDERQPWRTVVGVVGSIRRGISGEPSPGFDVYLPAPQPRPPDSVIFVVETSVEPLSLQRQASEAIWSVDPDQAVWDFASMRDRLLAEMWRERTSSALLGGFAVLALLLAVSGLYGLVSRSVRERVPEIGLRMALGAAPGAVLREVLVEALSPLGWGLVAGVAGFWGLGRLLSGALPGLDPLSPATAAAVVVVLAAAGAVAAAGPAWRASRTDPSVALRHE